MSNESADLVSILVPKEHVTKIYKFIGTLDDGSAPLSATPEGLPAWKPWPPALVRRQFDESQDTIKRFQKFLASHPGKRFLTSEIAKELKLGKGSKSIAGALGAYGRRTANRYKMEKWPFENEWNHVKGEQTYWMDAATAAIIKGL